jgi:DNA-binding transcriptional MerR regulator
MSADGNNGRHSRRGHRASVPGRIASAARVALATLIVMSIDPQSGLRIGEVSRRLGLSPEVMRAWERRYGVVSPHRTDGGTRCYSALDLERLRVMQREIAMGMAPNEAARLALALHGPQATETPSPQDVAHLTAELVAAARALDEPRAQEAIDALLSGFTEDFVLREVLLPLYFDSILGDAPGRRMSGAEEHFVENLLRGRLLGLARGWGEGGGPVALLSCAPKEQRDLALICFGIALRARGWRILFLGADTAVSSIIDVVRWREPDFVLVAATDRAHFEDAQVELQALGHEGRLALAGRELTPADAEAVGAHLIRNEPVTAASLLAEGRAP